MKYFLGIETSCDETALAIVEVELESGNSRVVTNLVSSQVDLHALYGGVVPELASREHLKYLPLLWESLRTQYPEEVAGLSAIGVSVGPGLKGCLLVGVTFAQGIARAIQVPIVPVNHIEGHLLSPALDSEPLIYPHFSLVVSGGHTELILAHALGRYTVLARTRDDAAGEAFDKSAALMGLEYPGGARLAALADSRTTSRYSLPKVSREIVDLSFSGLKTAVSLLVERERPHWEGEPVLKAELAWAVQDAIVSTLLAKVRIAVNAHPDVKELHVVGGVSANRALRAAAAELPNLRVRLPQRSYCTDNGAMIALTAAMRQRAGGGGAPCSIRSRWPLEEMGL
jgi:N6-L-threonylcarbamoyladenine synthase